MSRIRPYLVTAVLSLCIAQLTAQQYLGKFIGKLSELQHGVSGEVYAVDGRTLHVKDFTYDGQGPAAYFYAGNTRVPGNSGFRLRDENGSGAVIRRYRKEGITLTLPEGKSLNNIKIFYVWCEEFAVNFGDVKIPRNFDYPRPQKIDGLQGVHAISSDNIVIVDAQTLLIPNLSYDGEAPDAKFWVGRGSKPSPQGIRVPDENGKEVPLRRYDRKTIVLTLPGDLTVFDIGHFGIWCEAFTVDFGHVQIPQNLNIPPSLRMLGISPQKRPLQIDNTRGATGRPHVNAGGHLDATTFRPSFSFNPFAQRRSDNAPGQQHELVNRDIYSRANQNSIQQNQIQPFQRQIYHQNFGFDQRNVQPQPFLNQNPQQRQFVQQQAQVVQAPQQFAAVQVPNPQYLNNALNSRQGVPYTPLNLPQKQLEEQVVYNRLLETKYLQEQQLKNQITRPQNRFGLPNNQNDYSFG